jgi:hypothetical protein
VTGWRGAGSGGLIAATKNVGGTRSGGHGGPVGGGSGARRGDGHESPDGGGQ